MSKKKKNMLSEQIFVENPDQKDKCSSLAHRSKNLYNLATYNVKKHLEATGLWLRYLDLYHMLKKREAYRELPAVCAQQTLKLVDQAWNSFFKSMKKYSKSKESFKGRPQQPNFKKKDGEYCVVFTNQQCKIIDGNIIFPRKKCDLNPIKTRFTGEFSQVRIIPKGSRYRIDILYEPEIKNLNLNKKGIIGIDPGGRNLITVANNIGLQPFCIKGSKAKYILQFYNKEMARLRSVRKRQGFDENSKRMNKIHETRNNKIKSHFHDVSRFVINYCIENNIGTIVFGHNKGWKHKSKLDKKNNQNFVQIPHSILKGQIKYKAKLVGIDFKSTNEYYTSKCSFLDWEPMCKQKSYMGTRLTGRMIKSKKLRHGRGGLFRSSEGIIINADVNAAYNIIRKVSPKAFKVDRRGGKVRPVIEGAGLHPYCVNIDEVIRKC